MKKILPVVLLIYFLFARSIFAVDDSGSSNVNATVSNPSATATPTSSVPTSTPIPVSAATNTPTPTSVPGAVVTPTPSPAAEEVGEAVLLDISGFTSPNASIVMRLTNGDFVRSTTADSEGNFFISQIGVTSGFSDFCLEVIDFKRIGDSSTCFRIAPVTKSSSLRDLFLPPTLGLSSSQVNVNESIYAFGYSMKQAKVTVHLSGGITLITDADKTGYYNIKIEKLPVGTYQLFATASYNSKESEIPNDPKELQLLSTKAQIQKKVESILSTLFSSMIQFFNDYGWLAIPAIILLIILTSKKARVVIKTAIARRRNINEEVIKHGAHHAWMLGF